MFCCPDRLKHASSLNRILFTNAGFCFIWSLFKLQKVILACGRLPWCFVLCVSCKEASLNLSTKCCALLLISTLVFCQKSTDRPPWTFSIAGLLASMLAVDLPVFCLPLWGTSSTELVSKNFQPQLGWFVFEGLPR